jgi:hypothetical protein
MMALFTAEIRAAMQGRGIHNAQIETVDAPHGPSSGGVMTQRKN